VPNLERVRVFLLFEEVPKKIRNGAEIKVQIQASGFGLRFSVFWRMTTRRKQVNLAFEWREPAQQMPSYLSQKRGNIRSKDVHQSVLLFRNRSLKGFERATF
jgi:hypothetical protein